MNRFTLISRPGYAFRVTRLFNYFGIPCVTGVSLCGGFRTTARVADVVEY